MKPPANQSSTRIRLPSLRLHKPSGRAVVTVRGRDIYCGKFGTVEADANYRRVCQEILASGPTAAAARTPKASHGSPGTIQISVAELLLGFIEWAEGYYLPPSTELQIFRPLVKRLRLEWGDTLATEFGPQALTAFRQSLIADGLLRTTVNDRIKRVRKIWKWGVGAELLPADAHERLRALPPLRFGKSAARDESPKTGIPEADFRAILPHVSRQVAAVLEVCFFTGSRISEISQITTAMIDRTRTPWVYRPGQHKGTHRKQVRTIFFGPKARAILTPYLRPDAPDEPLFSPKQAWDDTHDRLKVPHRSDRQRAKAARNKRRAACEQRVADGRSATPTRRQPQRRYNRHTFNNAIKRACKRHEITHWSPHQLRHACKTRIDDLVGKKVAAIVLGEPNAFPESQAVLGHTDFRTTNRYGDPSLAISAQVMEEHG